MELRLGDQYNKTVSTTATSGNDLVFPATKVLDESGNHVADVFLTQGGQCTAYVLDPEHRLPGVFDSPEHALTAIAAHLEQ